MIGKSEVEMSDYTEKYRAFNVKRYVVRYLNVIPDDELQGISRINIYDDSPSPNPRNRSGGYSPRSSIAEGAEIDIFLNQTFRYMFCDKKRRGVSLGIKDKMLLMLFGKLFIADTLFHEIGHHKFTAITPKEYKTREEAEEDAETYATQLLWKSYPFLYRHYNVINKLYRLIFRKRIERARQIESKILRN